MSDRHIRILRQVARQKQRDLDYHDAGDHLGDPASAARRQDLAQTAPRTRARVAAAEAEGAITAQLERPEAGKPRRG